MTSILSMRVYLILQYAISLVGFLIKVRRTAIFFINLVQAFFIMEWFAKTELPLSSVGVLCWPCLLLYDRAVLGLWQNKSCSSDLNVQVYVRRVRPAPSLISPGYGLPPTTAIPITHQESSRKLSNIYSKWQPAAFGIFFNVIIGSPYIIDCLWNVF